MRIFSDGRDPKSGASLAVDEKLVAPDVVKLVREKEKEITDGLFRVNVNDAEPKAG